MSKEADKKLPEKARQSIVDHWGLLHHAHKDFLGEPAIAYKVEYDGHVLSLSPVELPQGAVVLSETKKRRQRKIKKIHLSDTTEEK